MTSARCILVVLAVLQATALAVEPSLWPVPDWPAADDPQSAGLSSSALKEYRNWLERKAGGEPFGSAIIRYGRIALEIYGSGATPSSAWDIGSIRKAVGSTVLGMAINEGIISVDQQVYEIWPPILSTGHEKDKAIRVRDLFRSCSGWKRSERPGVKWAYNNAAFTASGAVLGRAYHLPNDELAPLVRKRVAEPIGAAGWRCYHSSRPFDANYSNPGPKLTIESSIRDLARFGYLWLRQGEWHGRQLVPRNYIRAATTNQAQEAGGHYGYCWFVNDNKALLPSVPADAYYHVGNGQKNRRTVLLIVPSLDLIAIIGTDVSRYDITAQYDSVPVTRIDEWMREVLKYLVTAGQPASQEEHTGATSAP